MYKLFLILFMNFALFAGNYTITGIIKDAETGLPVANANLIIEGSGYGTSTDTKGVYYITGINSDKIEIKVSAVGYKGVVKKIVLTNTVHKIDISLKKTTVDLGEIIVVSDQFIKSERDVISPIEVIKGDKIKAKTPFSIGSVLSSEKGIEVVSDGAWATTVSIRGLSRSNIITMIDGNRMETATSVSARLSLADINDIDRIEVIKGASSSLYGSGATGGIVNIITESPVYTDKYSFSGKYSSGYNSVNNMVSNSFGVFSSSKWYRLKVKYSVRNAGLTDTPEGELPNSQFRDNSISVVTGFNIDAHNEVELTYNNFAAEDVGIPGGAPFPATAIAKYPETSRLMYSVKYNVNSLVSFLPLLTAKYFYQEIDRQVELRPNVMAKVSPEAVHTTHGASLMATWLTGKFYTQTGFDFWQRSYDGERKTENFSKNLVKIDKPVPNSTFRSIGAFVSVNRKVSDKFDLEGGARYDLINVTNDAVSNPVSLVINGNDKTNYDPDASYEKSDVDDFSWSANFGAKYHITQFADLSFSASRSYRAPSLEERYQYIDLGGIKYFGDPELKPESGTLLDLGFDIWQKNYNIQMSLFANFYTDLVVDSEVYKDSLFRKDNVGEAQIYGYELSGEYNFWKGIACYGNFTYLRGEDAGNSSNLYGIAPLNGTFGFKMPVFNIVNIDIWGEFYSDQELTGENENRTGGYSRFNLIISTNNLNYSAISANISAGVMNIFDRAYRNHLSTYRGNQYIEPGRNIFVKLNLLF